MRERVTCQYLLFQALFGDQIQITDGGRIIGTKHVDDFDSDMDDDMLADQEDLDLTTRNRLIFIQVVYLLNTGIRNCQMVFMISLEHIGNLYTSPIAQFHCF